MLLSFETIRVHFIDRPHTFCQGMDHTAYTEPTHAVIVGHTKFRYRNGRETTEVRRLHVSTARGRQEQQRLATR